MIQFTNQLLANSDHIFFSTRLFLVVVVVLACCSILFHSPFIVPFLCLCCVFSSTQLISYSWFIFILHLVIGRSIDWLPCKESPEKTLRKTSNISLTLSACREFVIGVIGGHFRWLAVSYSSNARLIHFPRIFPISFLWFKSWLFGFLAIFFLSCLSVVSLFCFSLFFFLSIPRTPILQGKGKTKKEAFFFIQQIETREFKSPSKETGFP